jgi:hypothetical protein
MNKELDTLLINVNIEELDDIIGRMEIMKIQKTVDPDVDVLISAISSLSTEPKEQKLSKALRGVKNYRKKIFARKYRSLKHNKSKKLTQGQMNDFFATMDALKSDQNGSGKQKGGVFIDKDYSIHSKYPRHAQLDRKKDLVRVNKRSQRMEKILKGGVFIDKDYSIHSKYPRHTQLDRKKDLVRVNKRSQRMEKVLKGGKKKKGKKQKGDKKGI